MVKEQDGFKQNHNEYLDQLKEKIIKSGRNYQLDRIEKAFFVADQCHGDQRRISGEPYIMHPVSVAEILIDLGMDTDSVVAALLHDVVEDTEYTLEELTREFSADIALLVDGVTKLGKIEFSSQEEEKAENIRKMLLAMSQDIRVMIIKLADRLHNQRTIWVRSDAKRREKSLETMEIFAPIAHRLGIRAVKDELEDISLHCLDPIAYAEIEEKLALQAEDRKALTAKLKKQISDRLDFPKFRIEARVKSVYSIYNKTYMKGKDIEEIYDIYAVRIIVPEVNDCYNCLGVIHDMYTPIAGRFKDYISTPKTNGYQSLHTTVIGRDSVPFEVQIRTFDMHHTAEYGVAAHWKYKEGVSGSEKMDERLSWVRQLLEAQAESGDAEDILRTIKSDIAPEEVFVFTPKGDVINLPAGSNVIDFAYAIHSAVGNKMIGAKVDGRIVSFDYQVKTGEIVEIQTTKSADKGPSREWLKQVKTGEARNKIRAWFKKEKREENIECGKAEVEKEFRRAGINLTAAQNEEFLYAIAKRQHCDSTLDLYAAIGYGGLNFSKLMPRIKDEYAKNYQEQEKTPVINVVEESRQRITSSGGIIVEGIDNCLVKCSKCCNPVPGDEIVGFITRGHGVSVHKKDCVNVRNMADNEEAMARLIPVHWDAKANVHFKSSIDIVTVDRTGMLADISVALSNMHIPIHTINAREMKNTNVMITMTVTTDGLEHLKSIMDKLRKIRGVISVSRSNT